MNGEPAPRGPVPEDLLRTLVGDHPERLVHVHEVPARLAGLGEWPDWIDPTLLGALLASGIQAPWSHQVEVAQAAHAGRHVVVSTGTASGKSLGYHLPILSDIIAGAGAPNGRGATALYLSPTKALAADQLSRIDRLALPAVRPATYDGDTPTDERRWIRDHANLVLTNPDLLHHSLLPGHGVVEQVGVGEHEVGVVADPAPLVGGGVAVVGRGAHRGQREPVDAAQLVGGERLGGGEVERRGAAAVRGARPGDDVAEDRQVVAEALARRGPGADDDVAPGVGG